MIPEPYRTKISNLPSPVKGYDIVALQETGERAEITALAAAAETHWVFTKGKAPPKKTASCTRCQDGN